MHLNAHHKVPLAHVAHPVHHELHHPYPVPHNDVHHAHPHHAVPHPVPHPVKIHVNPSTGYAKPTHGASLEEIFGLKTGYLSPAKPTYNPPAPAYHPPTPAPVYHAPAPAYKPGSLESVFGLAPKYVTPVPHYKPTTYKPKMPDYLHPHAKSLPPVHHIHPVG